MASEYEASCEEDPNFAVICAFLEKFGGVIGITPVDFCELQSMLENTNEVAKYLSELHIKLLRKIKRFVSPEKWEKSVIKFCHSFSSLDAWELERFGYKNAKLTSKVRILKELLEAQFDSNQKFKVEINKLTSKDLRSQPLGRDKFGHAYWFQSDDNYQIRVYKEDLDDEKWSLVAKDRGGLVTLISTLSDGDIKLSSDSAGNEDSNSLSEKPIIDTGQQDTDSKKTSEDEESNLDKEGDQLEETALMPSTKRPREEDDSVLQKFKIKNLEVMVSDISKETVVGEAIEDPVLQIAGEGQGEDNNSPPIIVGEAIEENILYFYGNGSGEECQTGNQPDNTEAEEDKSQPVPEKSNDKTTNADFESKNEASGHSTEHSPSGCLLQEKSEFTHVNVVGAPNSSESDNENSPNVVESEAESSNVTNKTDNKIINYSDAKASEKTFVSESDVANVELKSENVQQIDAKKTEPHSNKSETDSKNEDNSKVSDMNEMNPPVTAVEEAPCVKRKAYVCGDEVSENRSHSPIEENSKTDQNGWEETKEGNIHPKEKIEEDSSNDVLQEDVTKEVTSELPVSTNGTSEEIEQNQEDSLPKQEINVGDVEDPPSKTETRKEKSPEEKSTENAEIQSEAPLPESKASGTETPADSSASPAPNKSRPKKKAVKAAPLRKSLRQREGMKEVQPDDDKSKANKEESSITNSPVGDESVISVSELSPGDTCDVSAAADPLAVSDNEDTETKDANEATVSTLSLDFKESPTTNPVPSKPSPMRAVRKRGLEVAPVKVQEPDDGPGKRMKLKSRRQVDAALRRSVEQRIEQLHGSSSDSKDSEDEPHRIRTKSGRFGSKKKPTKKELAKEDKSKNSKEKTSPKKNSRILAGLQVEDSSSDQPQLRQSRRIAQIKIREQAEAKPAKKDIREETGKKNKHKLDITEKRKKKYKEEESEPEEKPVDRKKKKKKEKPVSQIFNQNRPWQSSSEDSDEVHEEEEEEIIEEEYEEPALGPLKSDHEFSPESADDEEDDEWQPLKRARTARKESDAEEVEDFPCQKCAKSDHPEWILLCDKCDNGWHCSCLRPPLLGIPEGDWFCPPCEHVLLLERLQTKLVEYDVKLSKKEIEDRRKERLAYVGISLNNVLPSKEHSDRQRKKRRHSSDRSSNSSESESEQSESESQSDSDEPIYQLRQRRQTKSYKFNEYDEMIKDAIGEEDNKPEDTAGNLGRGKDIQTIVKGLEPESKPKEGGDNIENDADRPSAARLKKMLRKKHRKLNSLDFDSEEEDISDEDFKGSSNESEDEEEEEELSENSEDSDDYVGRKRRKNLPVRRSTRARTKRYDQFINDDSDDEAPRRKKKKSIWDETTTEESDLSGYESSRKGKKKKKKGNRDDSEPRVKKTRPRIKYGGLTSSEEEDLGRGRRTRGKRTTYVDTLGSDSEEATITKKNPRKLVSDDDEDFVANEEEEGDEDEKNSEGKAEEEDEDDEGREEDEDEELRKPVKPPLIVPKIYIKKPLGAKKSAVPAEVKSSTQEEKTPNAVEERANNESPNSDTVVNIKQENTDLEAAVQPPESQKPRQVNPDVEKPRLVNPDVPTGPNPVQISVREKLKSDIEAKMRVAGISMVRIPPVKVKKEHDISVEPEEVPAKAEKLPASVMKVVAKKPQNLDVVHEPIVSNVSALIKNDVENDDLSEPPGISLPFFDDLSQNSNFKDAPTSALNSPKKRRGRGPGKKKLEAAAAAAASGTAIATGTVDNNKPVKPSEPAMEIAAPPQPFSQAQPAPSVITRMLQSKPGLSIYPVGRIRPKQFATMRDDDSDESSPKNSPTSSPVVNRMGSVPNPNQYNMRGAPRGTPPMPYRPQVPPPHQGINHFPRASPGMRGPPPHSYGHHPAHRTLDPSPSGGGPINLTDQSSGPLRGPPGSTLPLGRQGSLSRRGPPRYPPVRPPSAGSPVSGPRTPAHIPPPSHQQQQRQQQSYKPPPPSSNGAPPPVSRSYATPTVPFNGSPQPQQPYPSAPPTSESGPQPPSQSYASPGAGPQPPSQSYASSGAGPQPPAQSYPTPVSSEGQPPPSQPYIPPAFSGSGSQHSQPQYTSTPPPPTTTDSGSTPAQPPAPEGYYGNYPPPPAAEDGMPPAPYEGVPLEAGSSYQGQYGSESQPAVSNPSPEGKASDEETGGEFAGLASYFSSQREDDLDS